MRLIVVLLAAALLSGCGAADSARPPQSAESPPSGDNRFQPAPSVEPAVAETPLPPAAGAIRSADVPANAMESLTMQPPADVPRAPESTMAAAMPYKPRASVNRIRSAPLPETMSAPAMAEAVPERVAQSPGATLELTAPLQTYSMVVEPEETAPTAVAAPSAAIDESTLAGEVAAAESPYVTMNVFYGTDRAPANRPQLGVTSFLGPFGAAVISISLAVTFWLAARRMMRPWLGRSLATISTVVSLVLLAAAMHATLRMVELAYQPGKTYSNRRGTLEVGTCEVTIPRIHKEGLLESPSLVRLEFRQDKAKHIVFAGATPLPWDSFQQQLRQRVSSSSRRDAFVFVHGFNVSFEEAARRTAQIAYDLKFDGAPIFYSWPSQGGLMQYTVDETNVEWTVPHLKRFLLDVSEQSGAQSVHLIAHSMGNRALTNALRGIAHEFDGYGVPFNEVVLTAPDIDAEVFRRDIAPSIVRVAGRVTLYASSNDEALIASRRIHGFPRAGDSGADLLVLPGIDTIDVSRVDNTFLGHSYYASNAAVLSDLVDLLKNSKPPEQRNWLRAIKQGPQNYWLLLDEMALRSRGVPVQ